MGLEDRCKRFLAGYDENVRRYRELGLDHPELSYLISLGKKLDPFPEEGKIPENLVTKCQSTVYLIGGAKEGCMVYRAFSDSAFVRGELFIVLTLFNGLRPEEILKEGSKKTFRSFFGELSQQAHISLNRQYGAEGMYERIAAIARYCGSGCACKECDKGKI